MKRVNPKHCLREWLLASVYQQTARRDYALVTELQTVMTKLYNEQAQAVATQYCRLKPQEFSHLGGVSHMSCSS